MFSLKSVLLQGSFSPDVKEFESILKLCIDHTACAVTTALSNAATVLSAGRTVDSKLYPFEIKNVYNSSKIDVLLLLKMIHL